MTVKKNASNTTVPPAKRWVNKIKNSGVGVKGRLIVLIQTIKHMKKLALSILVVIWISNKAQSQEEYSLGRFTKIIASPHVNVFLKKGNKESIKLVYWNVEPEKMNVVVHGNKLSLYLDNARIIERNRYTNRLYNDATVTAYVTYVDLTSVEMRGEEELYSEDTIKSRKFKLTAYGESEIRLAGIEAKKFKTSLYGENILKIKSGFSDHQVYRLFGENKIDTRGMKSTSASTRIYGEGKITLNAVKQVVINAFGEPQINVEGTASIAKGIVIGRVDINKKL